MEELKKIIEFLKANNADESLIKTAEGLKPAEITLETVQDFLEKNEGGKKFLQSQKDAAVTKGIETFKEKTLPKLVEEEISKRYPPETEEQKKLRELTEKQTKLEREIKRKELLAKATQIAAEKGLPVQIIEKFIGDDEDTTMKNLETFENVFSESVKAAVDGKFKTNGREKAGGGEPPKDYEKMTDEEFFQARLSQENKN
jgi:DNA-binding transcriptional MerR regulator